MNQQPSKGDVGGCEGRSEKQVRNMWEGLLVRKISLIFSAAALLGASAAKGIKNLWQLRRNRVNSSS